MHRPAAMAWPEAAPNPARTSVNHKDGVKTNCDVSSLEWATAKENTKHAIVTGLRAKAKRGTPIEAFGEGIVPVAHVPIMAAARATGVSASSISRARDSGLPDHTGRCRRKTAPDVLPGEELN